MKSGSKKKTLLLVYLPFSLWCILNKVMQNDLKLYGIFSRYQKLFLE